MKTDPREGRKPISGSPLTHPNPNGPKGGRKPPAGKETGTIPPKHGNKLSPNNPPSEAKIIAHRKRKEEEKQRRLKKQRAWYNRVNKREHD